MMRPRRVDGVVAITRESPRLARELRRRRGDGVVTIITESVPRRMKTPVAKWVPRKNLSRKPKSAAAMELDKEEKAWQHQLYRARQAKERAEVRQALKDRQREIDRANELEERSGERKRKFDVDACREKRAQAEAQVLIDEKKAAQDEILRLTLVASADAAGMDAVAFKVRPRRPTSVPSLQYDSCPSHDDVGGLFFRI